MNRLLLAVFIAIDLGLCLVTSLKFVESEAIRPPEWSLAMSLQEGRLYRQWESFDRYPNAIWPQGLLRVDPDDAAPFAMPELKMQEWAEPQVVRVSELNHQGMPTFVSESRVLLYDEFPGPSWGLQPFSPGGNQLTLLLDASGTMGREDEGGSGYDLALSALVQQRKKEGREWNVHTFSTSLQSIGPWHFGDSSILRNLPKPGGKTRLLSALEEMIGQPQGSNEWVVISDGDITETDRPSVRRIFGALAAKGIRLSILSPQLQPLDRFSFAYNEGLCSSQWPSAELVIPTASQVEDASGDFCEWTGIRPVRGDNMQALLYSKEGWPVVFMQFEGSSRWLHICGTPQKGLKWVLQSVAARFQNQATVLLRPQQLDIDVGTDSLKLLRVHCAGRWYDAELRVPGQYRWKWAGAWPERLLIQHADTGVMEISGLDSLRDWTENRQEIHRELQWVYPAANPQLRLLLELWAAMHILLMGLVLWRWKMGKN